MRKGIRTAAMAILAILIVSAGSVSAMFYGQNVDSRAERIVEITEVTSKRVGDLIDFVNSSVTALEMIETAGLTEEFEGNVTLYDDGLGKVTEAYECLATEDYEGSIANATEALSIFKEVYRSIYVILCNSDVKIGPFVEIDELEEAIERSLERVAELLALISTEAPIYSNLTEAKELLTESKEEFLPENIEDAKANLREANILISEVYQYLKQVAQELNPQRIREYCDQAEQYRYRFRERFGQARDEGFDVDGLLQDFGYQNAEQFMNQLQEMIENAQGAEDIEDILDDLEEIGRTIREMDQALTQEMGQYRERYGQEQAGTGYGQEGSSGGYGRRSGGYGNGGGQTEGGSYGQDGSGGSGQMGFGSGQ